MSHLSPAQRDLIDLYDGGNFSDADFTFMALEAGLSHARIDRAILDRRQSDAVAAEELREERAAGGHLSFGAA